LIKREKKQKMKNNQLIKSYREEKDQHQGKEMDQRRKDKIVIQDLFLCIMFQNLLILSWLTNHPSEIKLQRKQRKKKLDLKKYIHWNLYSK
jgi:hypothetical protein